MGKISEKELLAVIQKALNLGDGKITMESSIRNVEAWDSLGHLGILVALDKLFEGRVASIKEMAGADSVQKITFLLKDNNLI